MAAPILCRAVLFLALGTSACTNDPSPSRFAAARSGQEAPAITPSTVEQSFSPRLDAEQSLLRLLDLIRGSNTIQDINAERLEQTFGVDFTANSGRLAFGERLTRDWSSSFELDPTYAYGPRFGFSFQPNPPGTYPPLTEVCRVDFDRFAADLQEMGFSREAYRAEHNRVIHHLFQRPGLAVTVYTRGEADSPPESITHACVHMIFVT